MKKMLSLVVVLFLLAACSTTQVIKTSTEPNLGETGQQTTQEVSSDSNASTVPQSQAPELISPDPSLYSITSLNNGRLDVFLNQSENSVELKDMENLLAIIYLDNCEKFKGNAKTSLYLSFTDRNAYDYLVSYENTTIGTVVARGNIEDINITSCG